MLSECACQHLSSQACCHIYLHFYVCLVMHSSSSKITPIVITHLHSLNYGIIQLFQMIVEWLLGLMLALVWRTWVFLNYLLGKEKLFCCFLKNVKKSSSTEGWRPKSRSRWHFLYLHINHKAYRLFDCISMDSLLLSSAVRVNFIRAWQN